MVAQRLPRGRHGLTREEVGTAQRGRLMLAMAEAVADHGYVGTSVAEVIKRAGVSREDAFTQTRAVFTALRETLHGGEFFDIAAELPATYATFWPVG